MNHIMFLQVSSSFLQVLGIILEVGICLVGMLATYLILRKNPRYLGNQIMASSTFGLALYALFILLYDLIATAWAIMVFYRIALSMILAAVTAIFFSMKVIVESTKWFQFTKNWLPYVIWWAGFTLYMIIDQNFIRIIESDVVNTQISIIPLAVMLGSILALLFYSMFTLYTQGIKNTSGISQARMKRFGAGLLVNMLALFVNIPGQLVSDPEVGAILDMLFFLTMFIAVIVLTSSFLMKGEDD